MAWRPPQTNSLLYLSRCCATNFWRLTFLPLSSPSRRRRVSSGALEIIKGVAGIKHVTIRFPLINAVVENSAVVPDINRAALPIQILLTGQQRVKVASSTERSARLTGNEFLSVR